MGFTTKEGMVRIDFFRDSGKWHETDEVDMAAFYCGSDKLAAECKSRTYSLPAAIIAAMRADKSFRRPDGTFLYAGCWAVVLEPYHEFAHPQMFRVPAMFDVTE